MDTKKLAATFAILIIALGIAGFAYAHWEKIVIVDGIVTTGTLHVVPSFHAEYREAENKKVADIGYKVYPERNYIEVWFKNIYPCLRVDGYIDLNNTGTIPVNLVDCKITATPGLYAVWNEEKDYWEIYQTAEPAPKLIAIGNYTFDFPDGYPQIDPGHVAYIRFWIHFEEGLPQDATFEFTITFTFWNWNEAPD